MTKNEYIVQCPRCGAEFPEREKFCPHCDTPNRKMICRSCGAQINASERVCKVCGAKNRRKTGSSRNFILIGVTVLAALGILLFPKQPKQADQPPAQAQEAVSQTPETPEQSTAQDAPEQSSQSFNVEKHSGTLFSGGTVEITIPSDYVGENATQEELDAKVAQTDGFKSATLNADGSVTYVMTEACHKKLMQELAQNIDAQLADMAGSSDYPNVISAEASSDYTSFTVTLSTDVVGLQDSLLTLAFYMYGGMYNAFNGTPVDNVCAVCRPDRQCAGGSELEGRTINSVQDSRFPPLVLLPAYVRDAGKQERNTLDVIHADAMHIRQLCPVDRHVDSPIVYPDIDALHIFSS